MLCKLRYTLFCNRKRSLHSCHITIITQFAFFLFIPAIKWTNYSILLVYSHTFYHSRTLMQMEQHSCPICKILLSLKKICYYLLDRKDFLLVLSKNSITGYLIEFSKNFIPDNPESVYSYNYFS